MKKLIVLLVLLVGCASPTAPDDSWSPAYDADWNAVTACWGVEPERPRVVVRQDCVLYEGQWDFNVGSEVLGDVWVHGRTVGNSVEVCPDLAALRHEFSHWVSEAARGSSGQNFEGVCWL